MDNINASQTAYSLHRSTHINISVFQTHIIYHSVKNLYKIQATFSKMTTHFLVSFMSMYLFFSEV